MYNKFQNKSNFDTTKSLSKDVFENFVKYVLDVRILEILIVELLFWIFDILKVGTDNLAVSTSSAYQWFTKKGDQLWLSASTQPPYLEF